MATQKKSSSKKTPVQKATKKVANKAKSEVKKNVKKNVKKKMSPKDSPARVEKEAVQKPMKKERGILCKLMPYFFLLFALVLAISLFIIRVLGIDDGAGAVGYGILWLFGGFFGGATVLLPLVFGYLGVKWCFYNVKWTEADFVPSSENYDDYRKARRRMILQSVMSGLVVLFVAILFATVADYRDLDLAEMWTDGAEELFVGGGVIGGLFGYLMLAAFEAVLTYVIVIFCLLLFLVFALGLTPDYLIRKIQEGRERRAEERALAWEAHLAEEEEEAERNKKEKAAAAAAAAAMVAASAKKGAPTEMPEEIEEKEKEKKEEREEETPEAASEPTETPLRSVAPAAAMAAGAATAAAAAPMTSAPAVGEDYGDDSTLDTNEYDNLDDIFCGLESKASQTAKPEEEAPEQASLNLGVLDADEIRSDLSQIAPEEGDGEEIEEVFSPYLFPPIDLLLKNKNQDTEDHTAETTKNANILVETLKSFRINVQEIQHSRGPTITRYELRPEAGVRVRSIANLVDDIALSLATSGVRIEAPIPGKPFVGIEVPNKVRATVYLRDLIENSQFTDAKSKLTASLGMDVGGNPIYFDITKMPHMIIAGATGMGKSVCINSIIISILYKARPEDVKLILIDPKKVEFNLYKDMPHLYCPIVSEPKKAAGALASAVAEMERRFELIEEVGVRDIASYNSATENDPYKEHLPHMVIIIDELADLMMTAPDEVETAICRLAQKARAAGIHIIIGTQRPSVDVITGLIKANIPSRIACTVASQVDSRTIIDIAGAEKLIGRGDMLFAPVGASKPIRVQGAFVSDTEVENVTTFVRENNAKAKYNTEFMSKLEEAAAGIGQKKSSGGGDAVASADVDGGDDKFAAAVRLAVEEGKISTSLMQRRLGVGYGRAAKIIDTMEEMGYVSKPDGNKPRRVLLTADEYARRVEEGTLGGGDE